MGIATKATDAHTKNDHVVQFIIVVVPGLQDVCFRSYHRQGGEQADMIFVFVQKRKHRVPTFLVLCQVPPEAQGEMARRTGTRPTAFPSESPLRQWPGTLVSTAMPVRLAVLRGFAAALCPFSTAVRHRYALWRAC